MTTGFLRCPSCSSAIRPGAAWCSLCHADLRSDKERAAAQVQASSVAEPLDLPEYLVDPAVDASVDPAEELHRETSPAQPAGRHARRGVFSATTSAAVGTASLPASEGEVDDPLADVDVDSMLAALGAADPLTKVAGRFSNKANVAMFAFGGAAVLTMVGLGAMFILGSFLH